MRKLIDSQLVILAGAARREDGSMLPLPKKLKREAEAIEGILEDLVKKKLAAEAPAATGAPAWRQTADGQPMTLQITAAGRRAIGAQERKKGKAKTPSLRSAGKPHGRKPPSQPARPPREGLVRRSAEATHPDTRSSRETRAGSKQANVIELLRRPQGASLSEMQKATGWQAHSVRGALSGTLKKKLDLSITSERTDSGERRYRIAK